MENSTEKRKTIIGSKVSPYQNESTTGIFIINFGLQKIRENGERGRERVSGACKTVYGKGVNVLHKAEMSGFL